MKNLLAGYSTPRPFSARNYERAINYDIQVVDNWLSFLREYTGQLTGLECKEVLELGPGADLGVGLYLLAKGAGRYSAVDVNNLVKSVPGGFYECFFEYLKRIDPHINVNSLRHELRMTQTNTGNRLNYVIREDFDIEAIIDRGSIDLIFSQAAFEHFDDVEETIRKLSVVAKPDAILIAEIDLKTHSRWIRDQDPNNIYRFSESLYGCFAFRGLPNRLRPIDYQQILQMHGWENILVIPDQVLSEEKLQKTARFLATPYQAASCQMHILSCILCATKSM
jgi:SAM-dependent methyltransferase